MHNFFLGFALSLSSAGAVGALPPGAGEGEDAALGVDSIGKYRLEF